ncbi:MAG TPA: hypothetical protein VFT95_22290 [Micromonosporaceae bacterium]|nr:hypothetical protein [Micromonosporaceae bacterium]
MFPGHDLTGTISQAPAMFVVRGDPLTPGTWTTCSSATSGTSSAPPAPGWTSGPTSAASPMG